MLFAKAGALCALLPVALSRAMQKPLRLEAGVSTSDESQTNTRKLQGRFLHITDIHPDPFYKLYSSTEEEIACHRHAGPAGYWGAETSDCDSPISLINATFKWIEKNIKDDIDFVIWTGDSARHDNDETIPRSVDQVIGQNQFLVNKFKEVFGSDSRHGGDQYAIPIIPSFGNNDILPHNLFFKGPNKWTKAYADIWRPFIPEEQRHGFDRGGWFFVEVIPNRLAVFSLNTMYFFGSNTAVDGCASRSEPGYEHFEWLRIQLQFLRERGVKAIMSGHVPPARNDEKIGWDETCWQKYAFWMQQYRDVIVGSVYGHMNIEHFILQDFTEIDFDVMTGLTVNERKRGLLDDISVKLNAPDYLNALRDLWSKLPRAPYGLSPLHSGNPTLMKQKRRKGGKRTDEQKFYDQIGGEYAERFSISHVAASVVPNFFSALRIYEYNISGIEDSALQATAFSLPVPYWEEWVGEENTYSDTLVTNLRREVEQGLISRTFDLKNRSVWHLVSDALQAANKKRKRRKKKKKKLKFVAPNPPSKTSPPGPAYSPQVLTWTGYRQYYANNTHLNNDFGKKSGGKLSHTGWNPGRHVGERPGRDHGIAHPLNFTYEIEYDTQDENDDWRLGSGLIARKWVELAARIGQYDPSKDRSLHSEMAVRKLGLSDDFEPAVDGVVDDGTRGAADELFDKTRYTQSWDIRHDKPRLTLKREDKHHQERKKRRKIINRDWFAFVSRAVVATMHSAELHRKFGEDFED